MKPRKHVFQGKGISPKLQLAVQPTQLYPLAEYAWRWPRRLVRAPLRKHTETMEIYLFQDNGISPKLRETVQPVHVHQVAEFAGRQTRGLVTESLCNPKETKEIF